MKTIVLASIVIGLACASAAYADTWERIGADKDAMGNDMRIADIDLASIKSKNSEISVTARITNNSVGRTGYNCAPEELRHGNLNKKIVDAVCNSQSSPTPYADHEPNLITIREGKASSGRFTSKLDLNSLSRISDLVTVTQIESSSSLKRFQFDCKGYYNAGSGWVTIDLTDHIATVPRGFISLERKISNRLCSGPS